MPTNAILTLGATESFLTFHTFTADHRRSSSFYVSTDHLLSYLEEPGQGFIESDCSDILFLSMINENTVNFRVQWLCVHGKNAVTGYQQQFCVPVSTLLSVIKTHTAVKRLVAVDPICCQSKLIIHASAQELVGKLTKAERHALVKCLSSHFFYGSNSEIHIYADWNKDLYFVESCCGKTGLRGGINFSRSVIHRNGHAVNQVRYSVNT